MTSASQEPSAPARSSGTFAIGGELRVHRLGFGAMRLPGVRVESQSTDAAREMLLDALPAASG